MHANEMKQNFMVTSRWNSSVFKNFFSYFLFIKLFLLAFCKHLVLYFYNARWEKEDRMHVYFTKMWEDRLNFNKLTSPGK